MNRAVSFANLLRLPALALVRPVVIFFLAQPHQVVPELNRQLLLRRRVRLTIPNLREGSVVYLRMDPVSDEGETMWSTLAWYTLNRIPSR